MDILSVLHIKPKASDFSVAFKLGFLVALAVLLFSCIAPGVLFLIGSGNYAASIAMIIAVFLSYGLIIIVPALMLAEKRGWKAGVRVVVYAIFWLLILACVLSFLLPIPLFMD